MANIGCCTQLLADTSMHVLITGLLILLHCRVVITLYCVDVILQVLLLIVVKCLVTFSKFLKMYCVSVHASFYMTCLPPDTINFKTWKP